MSEVGQYVVQGLTNGAVYALLGLCVSLVYGATKLIHFTIGDILAIGALLGSATLAVTDQIPVVLALIIAMIACGTLSGVVSLAMLPPGRRRDPEHDHGWIIAALAASIVIEQAAALIWGTTALPTKSFVSLNTVTIDGVLIRKAVIFLILVTILVGVGLDWCIRHTRWGMKVRAAGGDQIGVVVSGLNLRRIQTEVFFLAGALAALAAMLYSPLISASPYIGFDLTIKGFIAAVIGGLGNLRGALLGGFFLGLVEAFADQLLGVQWQDPISLLVLIVVLVVSPTGLLSIGRVRSV